MGEYNAFLEEWKQFKTNQRAILTRLDELEEKTRHKTAKKVIWLSGGLIIAFAVACISVGYILSGAIRLSSIPYAVATERGCKAMGGHWDIQKTGKYCFFIGQD